MSFSRLWSFAVIFMMSGSLSNCTSAKKYLSGYLWDYLVNLSRNFMFNLYLTTNCKSGILANICVSVFLFFSLSAFLSVCLYVCLSLCLSVPPILCPIETTYLPKRVFMEHNFWKICQDIPAIKKLQQIDRYFTWSLRTFVIIYE